MAELGQGWQVFARVRGANVLESMQKAGNNLQVNRTNHWRERTEFHQEDAIKTRAQSIHSFTIISILRWRIRLYYTQKLSCPHILILGSLTSILLAHLTNRCNYRGNLAITRTVILPP